MRVVFSARAGMLNQPNLSHASASDKDSIPSVLEYPFVRCASPFNLPRNAGTLPLIPVSPPIAQRIFLRSSPYPARIARSATPDAYICPHLVKRYDHNPNLPRDKPVLGSRLEPQRLHCISSLAIGSLHRGLIAMRHDLGVNFYSIISSSARVENARYCTQRKDAEAGIDPND